MTNFLEIDRDQFLIPEIIGVKIDGQAVGVMLRGYEQFDYDFQTIEQAEDVYLKVKQQLEAWHLNQNKIHSSI